MSSATVICPHCQTTLRATKPMGGGAALRCAQCGQRFLAPTTTTFLSGQPLALPDDDVPPPVPFTRSLAPILLAVCGAIFVTGAGIAATIWLSRPAPVAAMTKADTEKQRQLEEDQRRLRAREKELEEEKARLAFGRLLTVADAALARKEFSKAEKLYLEALQMFPDDSVARAGLVAAKTGSEVVVQVGEDKEKRQAEFNRLMALGRDKMTAKEYAGAVNLFQDALRVMATDAVASQALLDAQTALAKDQGQKEKLDKYNAHMEAGRKAMLNQRYADAVREYLAAGQVLPGDLSALKGQRDAERQVNDLADGDKRKQTIEQQLDSARTSLKARRYEEAITTLEGVLRLAPNDPTATGLLREARQTVTGLRAEFNRYLSHGSISLKARRYEEAIRSFQDAVRVFPDDATANQSLQTALRALEDHQVAQIAYDRYMRQGAVSMQNKRYVDAVASFREALRIAPADILAANGLRDALKALDKVVDRKNDYDRLLSTIKTAMQGRQWATAIQAANDALRLNPDDLELRAVLKKARYGKAIADGKAALQAKSYADAVRNFQDALDLVPGDATATSFLSLAKGMKK